MNGKHISLAALILAVVMANAVRAQNLPTPEILPQPSGYPTALEPGEGDGTGGPDTSFARADAYGAPGQAGGERLPPDPVTPSPGLSRYITYADADCCRLGGCGGPIGMELFLRTGPAFGIGGGVFAHTLKTGWRTEGGGRSLFFDEDRTAAWTAMLSLSHVSYHGQNPDTRIRLNGIIVPRATQNPQQLPQHVRVPQVFVTTRYLSQTFVNGSFGREWFLWGVAGSEGPNLRFGVDLGGRWGSANFGSHELRHRTDVVGGIFGGAQFLYETPCFGCCIFHAGLRLEYDWIWSDILQAQNNADLTNINLLMQAGFRY